MSEFRIGHLVKARHDASAGNSHGYDIRAGDHATVTAIREVRPCRICGGTRGIRLREYPLAPGKSWCAAHWTCAEAVAA